MCAVFTVLFAVSLFSADALVDWGTTHQNIDGFGACSAWSGSAMPAAIADLLFRTDASNIGLSIYRTRIPPDGTMTGELASVQEAQARNSNIIVWAAPWSPPAAMKNTGNVNTGVLLPASYQAYANYLTKYVKDAYTKYGLSFYALSVQNEADWPPGSYEGCTWSAQQLHDFVMNNLGPALSASSPSVKLMMPESFGDNLALSDTTLNDANAAKYVGIVGEHLYGLPGDEPHPPNPYPLAVSLGKQYWETEYYNNHLGAYDTGMTEGLNTALQMHNALGIAEFNAYHYWWMISTGADNGGLLPSGCATAACAPKNLYCFGNFSKFVRPGYVRIDTTLNPTAGVYVTAYKLAATGEFAIVAINTNTSGTSQRFQLNAMTTTSVTPWLTDASNSLAQQAAAAVVGGFLTYTLPAQSVVTFYGTSGNITVTPTFTPTVTPIPVSFLLDDCEDGNNTNNLGGGWYNYADATSTLNPTPFVMTAGGCPGSTNYCASMSGTIGAGGYGGIGTNLNAAGTPVDLTGYIGVEFYVKGTGSYWFQVTQQTSVGSSFGKAFTAGSTWTKVTVMFATDLSQRYGGPDVFTQNLCIALQWANNSTGAVDLQVDNIRLLLPATSPTNTPTYTTTPLVPTSTRTRTSTPTYSRTNTPAYTPTDTASNTASPSPVSSNTASPTATRTYTSTCTLTQTPASTNTASPSSTRTVTLTFSPTLTRTNTAGSTPTQTPLVTFSDTPTFTATHTATASATVSPVFSATFTPTITNTRTQTPYLSPTFSPTQTYTQSASPSPIAPSDTNTPVPTFTQSATATNTATPVNTPVYTGTFTPTFTATTALTLAADILFCTDRTGDVEVFSRSLAGVDTDLTNNGAGDYNPNVSHDGQYAVFSSYRTGTYQIFKMKLSDNSVVRLTNNTASDWDPTFNPDDTRVVFKSTRADGFGDIFIMNADGTSQVNLTQARSLTEEWDPDFTRDGAQIVFTSRLTPGDPSTDELFIMNTDGSNLRRLTNNSIPDWYPSCSPTADKILFVSKDGPGLNDNIYTMNYDGSGITKLSSLPGDNDDPYFSPDGTQIIFTNNNSGNFDMYIMNADGTNTTAVEINASNEICPVYLRHDLTPTPTNTPSFTFTATGTYTASPTFTETVSPSFTETPSATASPSVTQTQTIALQSPTFTFSMTVTQTITPSPSLSPAPSFTASFTFTNTAIPSMTQTPAPTGSVTASPTFTRTQPAATTTFSPTPGATNTPQATGEIIYPNPVNPGADNLNLGLTLESPADRIIFRIYSTGFRLIREIQWAGAPAGYYTGVIDKSSLKGLSSGLYYYRVEINYRNKPAQKGKTHKILILR